MSWRWRVYLTLLAVTAAYVGSSLALRRFQSEISAMKADIKKDKALILALAKGVNIKLATHHD